MSDTFELPPVQHPKSKGEPWFDTENRTRYTYDGAGYWHAEDGTRVRYDPNDLKVWANLCPLPTQEELAAIDIAYHQMVERLRKEREAKGDEQFVPQPIPAPPAAFQKAYKLAEKHKVFEEFVALCREQYNANRRASREWPAITEEQSLQLLQWIQQLTGDTK